MISNEPLIYIDANTREIDIKGTLKDFVTVTDDHNAETIFFVIDRYFDNVDLYDKVCEIKYMNAIGELDFDTAVNIETFLEDGTEKLKFGWKISNKVTKYYGAIKFQIMFYSLNYNEDGIVYNYVFNTKVTSIKIEEGLRHYSEINEDNYPDWAHEMYQQIHNVETGLTEDEAREIFESMINEKQGVFIINVTIDGNTYISDKTYPEIINAIENNNTVIILINSNTYIYPSRIWKTTDDNKNALWISAPYNDGTSFIVILEDGTIEVTELRFAEFDSLEQLWDEVGSVEQLLTNDKSSLVNAINEIVLTGTGSGGNITVDQTYKPTSANAQSGIAVAEAIISKQDIFLLYPLIESDGLTGEIIGMYFDREYEEILDAVDLNKQIIVDINNFACIPSQIKIGSKRSGGTVSSGDDFVVEDWIDPYDYILMIIHTADSVLKIEIKDDNTCDVEQLNLNATSDDLGGIIYEQAENLSALDDRLSTVETKHGQDITEMSDKINEIYNASANYGDSKIKPSDSSLFVFTELDDGTLSVAAVNSDIGGEIVIPYEYDGKVISVVADYGFQNCTNITKVTIPNTVTTLGIYAFTQCSNLKDIIIPVSVTKIMHFALDSYYNDGDFVDIYYKGSKEQWDRIDIYGEDNYIISNATKYFNFGEVEDLTKLQTDDSSSLVSAVNEITAKIKNIRNIEVDQDYDSDSKNAQSGKAVSQAVNLVNLAFDVAKEQIELDIDNLNAHMGDLQNLDTVNKVSVVDAINEVRSEIDQDRIVQSQNTSNIDTLMSQMGDIDTALDNIIAIQNSYIGGDSV